MLLSARSAPKDILGGALPFGWRLIAFGARALHLVARVILTYFWIMRSPLKKPEQTWIDKFNSAVSACALRGDYVAALVIARDGFRRHPDEFVCQYQYAKILGDYADELPAKRKKKLKKESARLLRPLLLRLNGRSLGLRFGICLNYYYQTEDFHGMYRYGGRFLKQDSQRSYYAKGLAAALIAHELHQGNKVASSRSWARKGVNAWTRYDLSKDRYYFAHYSAAKAWALSGDGSKAMKALKRAAVLGKRPISDWEFADVLALINGGTCEGNVRIDSRHA